MIKNYTGEELVDNYNNFMKTLETCFGTNPDRLKKLRHMYSDKELGTELTMAPASGKLHFHNAYTGGYMDHIQNVVKNSYNIKTLFIKNGGIIDFDDEELFFCAFHHDLGKLGDGDEPYYIPQTETWAQEKKNEYWKTNPKLMKMDVSDRTFYLLQKYDIKWSKKEHFGILLADGMYRKGNEDYYVSFFEEGQLKTNLPYIIHLADLLSTRIENSIYLDQTNTLWMS